MKKTKNAQNIEMLEETFGIEIAEPRTNRAPASAFKPGNPWAVKQGEVRNPNGRKGKQPDERKPVSKALRLQLNTRADAKITKLLGMPSHASWAQCLARVLLRKAISGDLPAATLLLQYTEGAPKQHIELDDVSEGGRRSVEIRFVESDGNGRPRLIDIENDFVEGFDSPRTIKALPEVAD